MKKKNTIKKLLSVILSAATVFSLLTLPAHAIIPGEDAYQEESHIIHYDCITGEAERVDLPDTAIYQNITTHSFLSEQELQHAEENAGLQAIIGEDERVKIYNPNVGQYSGIVLIIKIIDTDDDGIEDDFTVGTGFMVSENVMVTALHCLSMYQGNYAIMETRIYHGIAVAHADYSEGNTLEMLDSLPDNFNRLASIDYDERYFSSAISNTERSTYDWCVTTLQNSHNGYYFNCAVATSSLIGQTLNIRKLITFWIVTKHFICIKGRDKWNPVDLALLHSQSWQTHFMDKADLRYTTPIMHMVFL